MYLHKYKLHNYYFCFLAFVFLDSKEQLSNIKKQVLQISQDLHLSALDDASKTLNKVHSAVDTYLTGARRLEDIGYKLWKCTCTQ